MAGRIKDEDIAAVREKARIDDVVSSYVTLRNAGSGSMKGLCPFHDEKSPSFHVTPARGFFHCLAAETKVLTWEGARPISELAGGVHKIINARGDWVEAPFKSYGVQRLSRITVSRNRQIKELYATDEHRWFIRSGKSQKKRREVLTSDLKQGDRLVPVFTRKAVTRTTPSPFGIAHGFTYGDGTRSGTGSMALLCPPKDLAMLKWFPNSHTSASGDNLLVHHLPRFFKEFPDLDESVSYLYGWLAGYFAADGCVASDGTVMLNSADRADLEFVRTVCTRLGIGTYGITTQLREGFPGREPSELHRVHFVNEDLTEAFFLLDAHRERFIAAEKAFARRGWVVQSVEETDRVEEVFCAEVEDGHAFVLEDNILTGNCFGCQEGGDVFDFLMKIDGLSFTESVERMADKYGVQLRREDGGEPTKPRGPNRSRLVDAHRHAQEFYADALATPDALVARQFLDQRGFDRDAAATFGVGFSPRGGEDLVAHLRTKGFNDEELVVAGLAGRGRGVYDKFRGRLMWPIRDASGDVIGFGARRIFDDDRIEAKYLNTSETPIYKKSQVLYGIDLARKEIRSTSRAVIVEGYTDVMACHLSGVGSAVATCGTAFGDEHARVLRRFLVDDDRMRGEVIFTFDGDTAGQNAAMKVFRSDQNFSSQTYVAVAPEGMDPCDLRLRQGDEAVRALVDGRVPLYRFALENIVGRYDLDRADSRVDALREAAALVASVRDKSKVEAFTHELARMIGIDVDLARAEVRRANARPAPTGAPPRQRPDAHAGQAPQTAERPPAPPLPDLRDPRFALERETLKLVLHHPEIVVRSAKGVGPADFTHPTYRGVWELIDASGGPESATTGWTAALRDAATEPAVASALGALTVEPLLSNREPDTAYVHAHVYRLQEQTALRRINDLRSRLQRTNQSEQPAEYQKLFADLVALEQQRRNLREMAMGS